MKNLKFIAITLCIVLGLTSCEVDSLEEDTILAQIEVNTADFDEKDVLDETTENAQEGATRTEDEDDNPPPNSGRSADINSKIIRENSNSQRTEDEDDNPPPNSGRSMDVNGKLIKIDDHSQRTEDEDDNPPPSSKG